MGHQFMLQSNIVLDDNESHVADLDCKVILLISDCFVAMNSKHTVALTNCTVFF